MNLIKFIADEQERVSQLVRTIADNKDDMDILLAAFEPLALNIYFPNSLDFHFSGDKALLNRIWHIMRSNGWEATREPPEANATSWNGFWEKPGATVKVWISFTSTVCKRVQVGTQMVEQPIYEVRCEETSETTDLPF